MKNHLLAVTSIAFLAAVPAAALVPTNSGASVSDRAAAKKKDTPAQELAKEVAAAEAGVATLDKMRAAAAGGATAKPAAAATGKDAKVPESPGEVLTKTLAHLDLVVTYGSTQSQDKLVAAAKLAKAALEAHNWDAADAAVVKMKNAAKPEAKK